MSPAAEPAFTRFLRHVRFDLAGCWVWTGALSWGYGRFAPWHGHTVPAHRWLYERIHGPIPPGLEPDHLCRRRACIRPSHLAPVTRRENLLRGETITAANAAKTHCPHGHPYLGANLYLDPNGGRRCRTCKLASDARQRARRRGSP